MPSHLPGFTLLHFSQNFASTRWIPGTTIRIIGGGGLNVEQVHTANPCTKTQGKMRAFDKLVRVLKTAPVPDRRTLSLCDPQGPFPYPCPHPPFPFGHTPHLFAPAWDSARPPSVLCLPPSAALLCMLQYFPPLRFTRVHWVLRPPKRDHYYHDHTEQFFLYFCRLPPPTKNSSNIRHSPCGGWGGFHDRIYFFLTHLDTLLFFLLIIILRMRSEVLCRCPLLLTGFTILNTSTPELFPSSD